MKYTRIIGGEKNKKSNTQWSEEELSEVLDLFISQPDLKIHENNKLIQNLARKLGRTIRSVEAQLLMFRNLAKHGDYSFRNMSKSCVTVWEKRYKYDSKGDKNDG